MAGGTARWIQRSFLAAGLVILGYCGADLYNAHLQQSKGNRELDRLLSDHQGPVKSTVAEGSLVGRVEIPDLQLSAVVFQGTTESVLDKGVGHLDGSALPGQPGNVVLAAHRDTFFRSLRNIHKGDSVRVTTPSGVRTYTVDSTEVVAPTQTSVMDPTPSPGLTLITCYPFYFVGNAPKRFIVHARDNDYRPAPVVAHNGIEKKIVPVGLSQEDVENLTYVFKVSEE